MNRRGFIGALAGAFGLAAVDPEALLWAPGKKLISIPKPRFDGHPEHKIGDTIFVRKPMRFIGREGQAYKPAPIYESFERMVFTA